VDRISALKIPVTFVCKHTQIAFPLSELTTFSDGDHDWMDPEGGQESVERMRQAGNGKGRMYIVSNAGHHGKSNVCILMDILADTCAAVYLDNPKLVNDLLVKELDRNN